MSAHTLAYRHELDPAKLLECAGQLALDREQRNALHAMQEKGEKVELLWGKAIQRLRDKQRAYYFVLVGQFYTRMKAGGADVQDRDQVDTLLRYKFLSKKVRFVAGGEKIDYETGEVLGQKGYEAHIPLSLSRKKGVTAEMMEEFIEKCVAHYIAIFGEPPPARDQVAEIQQDIAMSGLWASLE